MRRKWEYGSVYFDAEVGFLQKDAYGSMADVVEQAKDLTEGDGTYAIGEFLRTAGSLGWEMVCTYEVSNGWHWLFKRELEG